jgi:hypothetical protein
MRAAHKCLHAIALSCAAWAQPPAMAEDNPLARGPSPLADVFIDGRWNGANLERRSNCTSAPNNGTRGTYAEFAVSTNTAGDIAITQNGITGLVCNYFGNLQGHGANRSAAGNYSCSDGKRGSFRTRGILVSENALSIRMDIALSGTETCDIDAVVSGARYYP